MQSAVHYFPSILCHSRDWIIPDRSFSISLDSGVRLHEENCMGAAYRQKTYVMSNKQIFVVKSYQHIVPIAQSTTLTEPLAANH